ncbi:hypothetical protein GOP47_0004175 [Adiantum capillus-veneris]|uniref:DUF2470 domain-containing protein n=1 Tax=Adiantum capillus-veneris TaxID=13818 RepID=A0A9D4ZPB2_ADICA|nr:hypothetical protein GOP47_0004175 [Adiantum capillus-veneris]
MAASAHFDCSSASGFFPGKRVQESGVLACQAVAGNASWRNAEGVSSSLKSNWGSSMVSLSDRHTFGTSSEHVLAAHKRHQYRIQVRVAADYPDSKPDASSYLGDLGYHPLEEISSLEKKTGVDLTERRLPDAEIARTIAEANETAILFASLWDDQDHIFGTEVEYIIDDRGDFYFQIDDDSEFLSTLNSPRTKMKVAIGYESIEEWILEQQEAHENPVSEQPQKVDSNHDEDEEEERWAIIAADGTEYVLEEILDEQQSPEETLGNWSGLDTLEGVHPLDFANALSTAALADDNEKVDKPSQSLRIVGEVRRLSEEEEEYVSKLCEDRFTGEEEEDEEEDDDDDDDDEEEEEEEEGEEEAGESIDISAEILEETGASGNGEEGESNEAGTSIYKLDVESLHLISYFRMESIVENTEFQAAKPDILARAGPEIVDRLNSRGKVLEDALKLVCLHRKGIEVEQAALLHIDSVGMDLRVHSGREIQTLRVSFSQRATSVEHAEQLLNQLLFPQVPLRGPKKRRSWPRGKSTDRT